MRAWKCLSLNPPWGSLVAAAAADPALGKRIETRSWATSYRGPLLIHQTKGLGSAFDSLLDLDRLCQTEPFCSALAALGYTHAAQLPRGAFVAAVNVVDCVPTRAPFPNLQTEPWFVGQSGDQVWEVPPVEGSPERAFGNYTPNRYALLLGEIRRLDPPIEVRGAMGLWTWTGEVP